MTHIDIVDLSFLSWYKLNVCKKKEAKQAFRLIYQPKINFALFAKDW